MAVLGILRGAHDEGQGPPDSGEEGGRGRPDVRHALGCREPAAQHDGGAAPDGREHAGEQRVAVEQRHGAVHDVIGGEPEPGGRPGHPPLGDPHGFGGAGRAGGEQQQGQIVGGRADTGRVIGADGRRGVVDIDHPGRTQVEAGQQRCVLGIGHDDRAVGVGDVAGQFVAPSGGIEADQDRARQDGRPQGEEKPGDVVEQHSHMGRPPGGEAPQPGRPGGHLGHHLGPRPGLPFEHQTGAGIPGPGQDGLGRRGEGLRWQWI